MSPSPTKRQSLLKAPKQLKSMKLMHQGDHVRSTERAQTKLNLPRNRQSLLSCPRNNSVGAQPDYFAFKIVIEQKATEEPNIDSKTRANFVGAKLEKLFKLGSCDTQLKLSMQKQLPNYQQRYQANKVKNQPAQFLDNYRSNNTVPHIVKEKKILISKAKKHSQSKF